MTPAIVVELPPNDAGSPYARALLESCNVAAQGRARCVFGLDTGADKATAVAIVVWGDNGGHLSAQIEIGVQVERAPKWQTRALSFAAADPEVERWRATGFAIATVVGDMLEQREAGEASAPAASSPPAPTTPPPPSLPPRSGSPEAPTQSAATESSSEEPRDATAEGVPLPPWWVDGVFSLGIAEADDEVAPGGELRLSHRLDARRWFLTGSAHCSVQAASLLQIVRPGVSAGVGLVALDVPAPFRFSLRVEPRLDLVDVAGTDAATGQSANKARGVLGVRQAADASWMWSERLGLVIGASVSEWTGPIEIQEHGVRVVVLPSVNFAAEGGFRLSLE